MKKWIYIAFAAVLVGLVATVGIQRASLKKRTAERDRYQINTNGLLREVEQYKIRDSLNVAKVGTLTLRIGEFEKYRAEDAALIKQLRADKKGLQDVVSMQTETITQLQNVPVKDSIIYVAGVADTVRCMEFHDQWMDFVGCYNGNTGTIEIKNREEIIAVSTVKYRRALGFLWRTKKIQEQNTHVVSKNQRTTVVDAEHVIITK